MTADAHTSRWLSWHILSGRHPSTWPRLPRYGLSLIACVAPLLAGWYVFLAPGKAALDRADEEEQRQKILYQQKLQQAAILPLLHTRRELLHQLIEQRQQQLFDSTDITTVLGEVATIATRHRLNLELAKPGTPIEQERYLAQSLQLSLRGNYHDFGHFAATLAATARPLWLHDVQLSANAQDGDLLRIDAAVFIHRQPAIKPLP